MGAPGFLRLLKQKKKSSYSTQQTMNSNLDRGSIEQVKMRTRPVSLKTNREKTCSEALSGEKVKPSKKEKKKDISRMKSWVNHQVKRDLLVGGGDSAKGESCPGTLKKGRLPIEGQTPPHQEKKKKNDTASWETKREKRYFGTRRHGKGDEVNISRSSCAPGERGRPYLSY